MSPVTMTEERIYHLLRNLNPNTENVTHYFPRLAPDFVGDVAKSAAAILADTEKKGSSRISCIQFLKRICSGEEGHIRVNQSNFETFIEASPLAEQNDFNDHRFLQEIYKNDGFKQAKTVLEEVEDFYNQKLELHKKRTKRLDFINACNQKTFLHLDYTPMRETENMSENVVVLRALKQKNSISDDLKSNEHPMEEPVSKRESDIKFAYAVLHLNSKQKRTVIDNVLCELENRKPLRGFEHEFLKYLFKTEDEFRSKLLELHPYLLETLIVEVCTKVLDPGYAFEEDQQFLLIRECFNLNTECRNKVMSMFYELFVLADYNTAFLKPINELNKT